MGFTWRAIYRFGTFNVLVGLLIINSNTVRAQQQCTVDEAIGNTCVTYQSSAGALTWNDAADYCANNYQNGYLATIEDETKQSYIESLMSGGVVTDVWIGGTITTTNLWYWQDGSVIEPQGCYLDDPIDRDLQFEISLDDVSHVFPSVCISRCYLTNSLYTYAGLQNGDKCFCGLSFGRHSTLTTGCTTQCRGNDQLDCGGINKNFIYRIGGSYAEWAENQPNNFEHSQKCGAIDEFNNYDFADERCDRTAHYICEIEAFSNCDALNVNPSDGTYVRDATSIRCFFLANLEKTFFNSKMDCVSRNGDLVVITSDTRKTEMASLINTHSRLRTNRFHWIGLSRLNLFWQNGDFATYVNYAAGRPTDDTDTCLSMSADNSHQWTDHTCTLRKPFFCQYDLVPPTLGSTTPSTSSTAASTAARSTPPITTAPTITTTAAAISSTSGGVVVDPPKSNKSKKNNNDTSSNVYIAMLIICTLLLVAIIVLIVVVCLLRKKKEDKKRRNIPPENVYAEVEYTTNAKPTPTMRSQSTATLQSEIEDSRELRVHMTSPDQVKIKSVKGRTCPKCHIDVKSPWKHLVNKHGVEPGSTQLHQLMSQSKGHATEDEDRLNSSRARSFGRPPLGSIATRDRALGGSLRGSTRGSKHLSRPDFKRNRVGVSTEEDSEDSGNESLGRRKGKREYTRAKRSASHTQDGEQATTDDEYEHKRVHRRNNKRHVRDDDDEVTKPEESNA